MSYNERFGRVVDGKLELAPRVLMDEHGNVLISPSPHDYLKRKWKIVVRTPQPKISAAPGTSWKLSRWMESGRYIFPVWEMIPESESYDSGASI